MSAKSHFSYLLGETELYKELKGNFKLTSHFGVIVQIWLIFFLVSLHIFFTCPIARVIWFQSLWPLDTIAFNVTNMTD
jgi:hypothetical protein